MEKSNDIHEQVVLGTERYERPLESVHRLDDEGRPAGGSTYGRGIDIEWQNGPVPKGEEPSGAFVEDAIAAAADRIQWYQSGDFACVENAEALDHLNAALAALRLRTARRTQQGVEGQHAVHTSAEPASERDRNDLDGAAPGLV